MKPSPSIEYYQLPHIFYSADLPIGKRLVVVGQSTKGDYYNPVTITSKAMAEDIFGSGPLLDRFQDVLDGGASGAFLMRMEGEQFKKVLDVLTPFPLDLLVIDGMYYNNHQDMITNFIEFAKDKEYQGQLIHGFFGLHGLDTFEQIESVFELIQAHSIPTEDGLEETGKYISVVVDQFQDKNAAAVYAGLAAALSPEISPVNKTLNVSLKYEFDKEQIFALRAAGLVCFKDSFKKGVVCTSSTCAVATEDTPHKHLSNFRIAQVTIQEVAQEQQKFVGRVGVAFVAGEVEEIVESILLEKVKNRWIKDYGFLIQVDQLKGLVTTEIELVPVFSVHSMTHSSQVRVKQT